MATPFDEDDPTPRATPGKRPAAPPPKGPAKPVGKAPPVVPPAEREVPRLAWGHVGSLTRAGRLSDGTSRPGVIRVVEAGISYYPPPLDHVWSQASLNYVGQYEMPWPEGDPANVRSLADFAAELQRGTPSKPQLKTLDTIADTLLLMAEHLHENDHRLGLLELGNVLIVPGTDGRRVVLPDVGFVWRGSHGQFPWKDSPGRPRWLDDPPANQIAKLWDEEPARQQFTNAEAAGDDQEPVPASSDLKTLARLFAAVITGRIERNIKLPNGAAVWGVLRSVMKGDIGTAAEFRRRLSEHRLSEHWLAPHGPRPNAVSPAVPILGAIVAIAILAGIVALVLSIPMLGPNARTDFGSLPETSRNVATNSSKAPVTRKEKSGPAHPLDKKEVDWQKRPTTEAAEVADLIKQLDKAKDPKLILELLVKLYQVYERSDAATRDKIRPWIEYYRGLYVDNWTMRYREADDALIKNVGLRFEVGKIIHDLNEELAGLRRQYEPISPSLNEREEQCLLVSELRSRELGSPQ